MRGFILLFLFLGNTCLGQMDTVDFLIKGCKLIDGSGNPWRKADVAILKDKIYRVASYLNLSAKHIIDAQGLCLSPGFIDVHVHAEGSIEHRPEALNFIYNGVTTLITGNCGNSALNLEDYIRKLLATGIGPNLASLIGHNTLRKTVMGNANRLPTTEELQQMKMLVDRAMEQGAVGLSTGLIYVPGTYAQAEEIIVLAKEAARHGGVYASHVRDEGDQLFSAIDEATKIGQEAHIPVEISHFKSSGKPNWFRAQAMIDKINAARHLGIDVTVDQYPYTASSTRLDVLLPAWALEGESAEVIQRINDPALRKTIRKEMLQTLRKSKFKNYSYAVVGYCAWDTTLNALNISEITNLKLQKKGAKAEVGTILWMMEQGGAQMIYHKMHSRDVEELMQYPFTMFASDSGIPAFGIGSPHPRAYGTNLEVLGTYVREKQILTLEDAIRRMTSLPAAKFNVTGRGLIQPGFYADVLLFDANRVKAKATYDKPHAYSSGITHVWINGEPIIKEAIFQKIKPGRFLYGPGYKPTVN